MNAQSKIETSLDKLISRIGQKSVLGLLDDALAHTEGFNQRDLRQVVKTMTVCDENQIDGG